MVRLSGYKEGERLLDPFCLSGTIPIEASLYENKLSVNYYEKEQFAFIKFMDFDFEKVDKKSTKDKGNIFAFDSQFKNADAARKNAKIAGINKAINFSRLEIEWLDTKFDEESVDRIVCFPPHIPKFGDKNITIKLYDELFHQAEFILKKKGTVLICTINPIEIKEAAAKKKFNLDFERGVWQGKEKLTLLKLSK
jgi:putative N6-adenine-specific DNA methylase